MSRFSLLGLVSLAVAVLSASANAQYAAIENLAGPRVGFTLLSGGITSKLKSEAQIDVGPVITQFGWQVEKRFLSTPDGFTGVTEFVGLVGGMDQGQVLPSATWLVGFRTPTGLEFAVGPNVTPISASIAYAGGVTLRYGSLNVPVNLAIVPSHVGVRMSLLTGFNLRR